MKPNLKWIVKSTLFTLFLVLLLAGCSKKIAFQNSSVVPAAEGTVSITQDDNENHKIDLTVKRLADPSRLSPPKNVYVVWIETSQSGTINIGQLTTSTKGFSNMLTSSLSAVSPHKPQKVFITAEDNAEANYPSMLVILEIKSIF